VKAVVVGSSGGVGRWVVHTLACDPRVETITALTRRTNLTADFFHLEGKPEQFAKVQQKPVDFNNLNEKALKGHDIGFSALGLYTAEVKDEQHFRQVEIDYNMKAARAMYDNGQGVKRFAYLSGQGVSQDGSRIMFARVKGEAEKSMQSIGFERATMARPGGIYNRGEDGNASGYKKLMQYGELLMKRLPGSMAIDAQDIAKAMVHSTLKPAEKNVDMSKMIWEHKQLKLEALAYTNSGF